MGNGARGLQRGRQRLGLLPARPGAVARLSLERRRHRRHLRSPSVDLLRARIVERAGPDPEGAAVRAHRKRGQSRRGRQGVLLLSGQHADALVHEVSATSIRSVRSPTSSSSKRTVAAAGTSRSSSWPTRACSPTTAISMSSSSTRRPARNDILIRITAINRASRRRTAPCAADDLVPQHVVVGTRDVTPGAAAGRQPRASRVARAPSRRAGRVPLHFEGAPDLLFTENETNRQRLFGVDNASPFVKDGINDYVVHGVEGRGEPAQRGTKAAGHYRLTVGAGGSIGRPAAVDGRVMHRRSRTAWGRLRSRVRTRGSAKPTSSTRPSFQTRSPRTRPTSCARRSAGCSGRSSSTTTSSATG